MKEEDIYEVWKKMWLICRGQKEADEVKKGKKWNVDAEVEVEKNVKKEIMEIEIENKKEEVNKATRLLRKKSKLRN